MRPFAFAAVTAGAVVALAACGHGTATSAAPAGAASAARSAPPVNCPQQYDAWRHGHGRQLVKAIGAVDAASAAGDIPARTAALKKAGSMLAMAARYPIPACADPQGFWTALVMHVNAAAGSTRSAPGRTAIKLALKGVSTLQRELSAELKRTAG
jgi:hypothetical protein